MDLTTPSGEAQQPAVASAKSRPAIHEQSMLLDVQNELPAPEIISIRTQKQADRLLFDPTFQSLTGISYVASLSLIEELFEKGYQEVELVVGDDFGEAYLKELKEDDIETVRHLAQLVVDGKLRLYFPMKLVEHSKLYILSKPGRTRILFGSANLTENARQAKQANMMWSFDLPEKHPFVFRLLKEYEKEVKRHCTLFMGDLAEELKSRMEDGRPEKEIIEAWLNRSPESEEDTETVAIIKDATLKSLDPERNEVPIIALDIPKGEKTDKKIMTLFDPVNPNRSSDGIRINAIEWAKYVTEKWHVPLMVVDLQKEVVRANVRGTVETLTAPLPEPDIMDAALAHIEEYIDTVRLGVSPDPLQAKQCMFEAFLFILSSPFANERMKAMRDRHGVITRRGPQVLYITGPSSNGKTAFLKFSLKILTGHNIEPIDGQNFFRKRQVRAIRNLQTSFPMIFDDVSGTKDFENIVKPYWETEWRSDLIFPQLVLTSNMESLKDWAKTRVKLIRFDVHFTEKKENKDILSRLLDTENHLFKWFSYLYLKGMSTEDFLNDDQLKLARTVMLQLYSHAGRKLPDFFMKMPLELIHDPGKSEWNRLIRLRKVTVVANPDEAIIDFAEDIEPQEMRKFEGHLPQSIKHKRTGKSLVIENPDALFSWIEQDLWPRKEIVPPVITEQESKRTFTSKIKSMFRK